MASDPARDGAIDRLTRYFRGEVSVRPSGDGRLPRDEEIAYVLDGVTLTDDEILGIQQHVALECVGARYGLTFGD